MKRDPRSKSLIVPMIACGFALPTTARAVDDLPDFSLGVGYANISLDDSLIDSENAFRIEGYGSFAPLAGVAPQIRLGAGLGSSWVFDDSQYVIISDGGAIFAGQSDVPLILIEPEVRLSWRQYLSADENVFVEPGVGFAGVFANLNLDADDTASGDSFNEWESNIAGRAFINVGWLVPGGVFGAQASYLKGGELDFAQNARGDVEEWYVGFFGALRF